MRAGLTRRPQSALLSLARACVHAAEGRGEAARRDYEAALAGAELASEDGPGRAALRNVVRARALAGLGQEPEARSALVRARGGGSAIAGGGEQDGRFARDDVKVLFLGGVRIAGPHQLQDLSLGDDVGGLRHVSQDIHVAQLHHELKGAGVQEVANQYRGGIPEFRIGGGAAAAGSFFTASRRPVMRWF